MRPFVDGMKENLPSGDQTSSYVAQTDHPSCLSDLPQFIHADTLVIGEYLIVETLDLQKFGLAPWLLDVKHATPSASEAATSSSVVTVRTDNTNHERNASNS